MKEVEKVLTITALKKLLKLKHRVKEDILLGLHNYTLEHANTQKNITDYHLFLTKNGFEAIKEESKRELLVNPSFGQLIFNFNLEHQELNKILQDLEGNERS